MKLQRYYLPTDPYFILGKIYYILKYLFLFSYCIYLIVQYCSYVYRQVF